MLFYIDEGLIESGEGFSLFYSERRELTYKQEEKKLILVDRVYKKTIYIGVSNVFYWDEPENLKITPAEKTKIMSNIERAIKLFKTKYAIL